MFTRRSAWGGIVVLVVVLSVASPALATPSPDSGIVLHGLAAIEHWWSQTAGEWSSFLGASRDDVDPNGTPTAADPLDDDFPATASQHDVDPNG